MACGGNNVRRRAARGGCSGVRRAACGVRRAACGVRRAAGGDDGDGNALAVAACGDVRLFSSRGDSNVIRYLIYDLAFSVPGAPWNGKRKEKTRVKDDFRLI
jgi:hypothetical protein